LISPVGHRYGGVKDPVDGALVGNATAASLLHMLVRRQRRRNDALFVFGMIASLFRWKSVRSSCLRQSGHERCAGHFDGQALGRRRLADLRAELLRKGADQGCAEAGRGRRILVNLPANAIV
jgi:hypothetical protein